MLTELGRSLLRAPLSRAARALARRGVRAWHLTLIPPVVTSVVVLPLLALGYSLVAVAVAVVVLPFDALDGYVARQSPEGGRGELADIVADRVADGALWAGAILVAARGHSHSVLVLTVVAAVASHFQSAVGLVGRYLHRRIPLGPFQRTERLAVLLVALAVSGLGYPEAIAGGAAVITIGSVVSIAMRCRSLLTDRRTGA